MLKSARRVLAIATVEVLLLIAIGSFLAPLFFCNQQNENQKNNSAYCSQDDCGQCDIWWHYSGAWIAIFTVVLTVSTAGLWWVTERTLGHAQADAARQAKDMEASLAISKQAADAAVAGQRPWLKVSVDIDGPLIFGPDIVDFFPRVTIKNVGKTPATNAQVTVSVRPESVSQDERKGLEYAIFEAKRIARNRKIFSKEEYAMPLEGIFGVTVFPGEEIETSVAYNRFTRENLNYEIAEGGGDPTVCVYVVASVDYQFPGGEGLTVAPFALERIETRWEDDEPGWFDGTGQTIEQSNLRLRRLGLYDSAT